MTSNSSGSASPFSAPFYRVLDTHISLRCPNAEVSSKRAKHASPWHINCPLLRFQASRLAHSTRSSHGISTPSKMKRLAPATASSPPLSSVTTSPPPSLTASSRCSALTGCTRPLTAATSCSTIPAPPPPRLPLPSRLPSPALASPAASNSARRSSSASGSRDVSALMSALSTYERESARRGASGCTRSYGPRDCTGASSGASTFTRWGLCSLRLGCGRTRITTAPEGPARWEMMRTSSAGGW
jgi:hypothetical protein